VDFLLKIRRASRIHRTKVGESQVLRAVKQLTNFIETPQSSYLHPVGVLHYALEFAMLAFTSVLYQVNSPSSKQKE